MMLMHEQAILLLVDVRLRVLILDGEISKFKQVSSKMYIMTVSPTILARHPHHQSSLA
jgi:hypothetical protein